MGYPKIGEHWDISNPCFHVQDQKMSVQSSHHSQQHVLAMQEPQWPAKKQQVKKKDASWQSMSRGSCKCIGRPQRPTFIVQKSCNCFFVLTRVFGSWLKSRLHPTQPLPPELDMQGEQDDLRSMAGKLYQHLRTTEPNTRRLKWHSMAYHVFGIIDDFVCLTLEEGLCWGCCLQSMQVQREMKSSFLMWECG